MLLITISNYMAFLATDLIDGNVNAKNNRIWLNLIRAWTRLITTTASSTTFKIRASIVGMATAGEHGIRTIETTRGTMENSMITIKPPLKPDER